MDINAATDRFVTEMTDAPKGREMSERVFRQLTGASVAHAACVPDRGLAADLLRRGWTFAQVARRES